jgi:hypothetical protein
MWKTYSLFIFYCAVCITPSSRWRALVLFFPSPFPFQFLPDLHLLVLELTPIPHVNLGVSKFVFGLVVLNSLSVMTCRVGVHALAFASELFCSFSSSLHCYVFVYIVVVNFISWSLDCFHKVISI